MGSKTMGRGRKELGGLSIRPRAVPDALGLARYPSFFPPSFFLAITFFFSSPTWAKASFVSFVISKPPRVGLGLTNRKSFGKRKEWTLDDAYRGERAQTRVRTQEMMRTTPDLVPVCFHFVRHKLEGQGDYEKAGASGAGAGGSSRAPCITITY
ncbi:hypothetical protein MSAN_02080300 [Mycena sanguinolenta]|uniref:Uncharacterized protein n=1 Tax=Mycena sanguinolenta TaxID=230812 RepID=A0A8H6XGB9_9AGAR|nr:hypothetical protein MSAN_02080300 [Mycena sanguinolenta]